MIATVEISAATRRAIQRRSRAAADAPAAMAEAMDAAVNYGADTVRELLVTDGLGLDPANMRPGEGLAASVAGWMLDDSAPAGAIGVPSDAPAARYAAILQRGGTIRPRVAAALAVPVSEEARQYSTPRDMPGLTYIPRSGRPPLLVRLAGDDAMTVHWVLVKSVTIEPRYWLTEGVERASGDISNAFADEIGLYLRRWEGN